MTDNEQIRATEKAKGGLKYELVLQEPATNEIPKKDQMISSPPKNMSVEEIEQKLKAAEERRLTLEAQKVSQYTEKEKKLQEASQKRQEFNNNFIQTTKETLEQKMEAIKENRESRIKAMQEKLKERERHAEEVRQSRNQNDLNNAAMNQESIVSSG